VGYVESSLLPNETVVHRARVHGIVLVAPIISLTIWLLGAAIAAAAGVAFLAVIAGLLAAISLLSLLSAVVRRSSTELAVTNKRVIAKVGVLSRRTLEMNISKIENVGVEQGLFARMAGYGTVLVIGTGGTREAFATIGAPMAFRAAVQTQMSDESTPATARADPQLTECAATKFTVRTAGGEQKVYSLPSASAADIAKAMKKLKEGGCTILSIDAG